MSYLDVRTWGLKLSGADNQSLRFFIRRAQRSLVTIPGYGVPLLDYLMPLAARYQGCLEAILALATRLRFSAARMKIMHQSGMEVREDSLSHVPNEVFDRYQRALYGLRSTLALLRPENGDCEEAVAVSLILLLFGFPSHEIWSVHLNGLIALLEAVQPFSMQPLSIYATASKVAAHADIHAFSLGRTEPSRRLWLSWNICPVERIIHPISTHHFSPLEISCGYPESLLTIIALLSAIIEDEFAGRSLDSASHSYLQSLTRKWRAGQSAQINIASTFTFNAAGETSALASKSDIEFVIARWQPPSIPAALPVDTSLTLSTAWDIMRKAAMIYLWRGGFESDVLAPLHSDHYALIDRFIREMFLGIDHIIQAAEQHHITIANSLIWPLVVVANECSRYPELQPRVLSYLQRLYTYFTIPHHQLLEFLLRKLWERATSRTRNSDVLGDEVLSLRSICFKCQAVIPLL